MPPRAALVVAVPILVTLAVACRASAPQGEIQALIAEQQAAWNRGDIEGFMARGYWNAPELVFFSGGEVARGYGPMLERYLARYQRGGAEAGQLTFAEVDVQPLGDEHALARGHWFLDFERATDVGGLFTLVLERRPEGWRIVHDHTSVAAPTPAKVQ